VSWPSDARVVPVVTVHDAQIAVPLAEALADGGIGVLELTMRTPEALAAMRRVRRARPDVLCGAGTVLTARNVDDAVEAGAQFLVSPGSSPALLEAMRGTGLPCLPGAYTPSEAMAVLAAGFDVAKFFPAAAAGGVSALAALAAPLPSLRWCATGGVTLDNAPDYLALPQVAAVGGSWLSPQAVIDRRDWDAIRAITRATVDRLGLGTPVPTG
jgi:2-dehydro-3-deoxyphosphogluconate aldolase/(4S)-4-hydroxy-2-oxoglutarate aldolase